MINEKRNDKIIEIIFKIENSELFEIIIFFIPNIDTAKSVGIDKRNDIFAASYLLKFKIRAAVMVIPDLLTPGIKDKIGISLL